MQVLVETAIAVQRGQPVVSPLVRIWSSIEIRLEFQGLLMLSPLIVYAFVSWIFAPVRRSVRPELEGDSDTTALNDDGKTDGKTQWCVYVRPLQNLSISDDSAT